MWNILLSCPQEIRLQNWLYGIAMKEDFTLVESTIHWYSWRKYIGPLEAERKYVNVKMLCFPTIEDKSGKSNHGTSFISSPQKTFTCLCKNCCRLCRTFYHYPRSRRKENQKVLAPLYLLDICSSPWDDLWLRYRLIS